MHESAIGTQRTCHALPFTRVSKGQRTCLNGPRRRPTTAADDPQSIRMRRCSGSCAQSPGTPGMPAYRQGSASVRQVPLVAQRARGRQHHELGQRARRGAAEALEVGRQAPADDGFVQFRTERHDDDRGVAGHIGQGGQRYVVDAAAVDVGILADPPRREDRPAPPARR